MLGKCICLALVWLSLALPVVHSFSCKSLSGSDVDWFFSYKLPVIENTNGYLSVGTAFLYADSTSNAWIPSPESIESNKSAIGKTVQQLFRQNNQEVFYALYNDEHPNNKTDGNRGHMKGVLLFDDFEGIWLIHSVPNFPSTASGSYEYPNSGKRNGQSFLCVTFPTSSLDEIGKQLLFGQPSVYEKQLPSSFQRLYPNLALAVNGKSLPKKAHSYSSSISISSAAGRNFVSFSKHKKFAKDLYADFVAPGLGTSLYVETWLNGGNDLTSECNSSYKVYNLRSVRPFTYNFKNSKDHSKWAVSADTTSDWICVGDINRQKSQMRRGGGTMCLEDAKIAALYRLAIGDVECCETNTKSSDSKKGFMNFVSNLFRRNKTKDDNSTASKAEPAGCVSPPASKKRKRSTTTSAGSIYRRIKKDLEKRF